MNKKILSYILIGLFSVFIFSCSETNPTSNETSLNKEPTSGRGAIVSKQLIKSSTISEIDSFLRSQNLTVKIKNGVDEYKIVYETIDPKGNKINASGFLAIPNSGNGSYPIASYQHGTVFERNNVPSARNYESTIPILYCASGGYVSPATDYLGLGDSPGFHPYVVAKPTATSVIDMIRASKWMCKRLGVKLNSQLFLYGYSEGGYATMATHKEIEQNYSTEFNLVASSPMAGPYDLSNVMSNLLITNKQYRSPGFLPYTVLSYQSVYNMYSSFSEVFKDQYLTPIENWYTNVTQAINYQLPSVPRDMLTNDFISKFQNDPNFIINRRLYENDLTRWSPVAPMKLSHSTEDDLVPYQNTINAYNSFKTLGSKNVVLDTNKLGVHETAAGPLLTLNMFWFDTFKK
ncbi:MAG: hypothetical protein IPP08_02135 [Chlorobiota bacterium]|nr:hypothetical protein [Chlorobiota bacterium]QQS66995.1 MAG: hypothetical protein IPP08_02135 [Chlorobiota bacterium]